MAAAEGLNRYHMEMRNQVFPFVKAQTIRVGSSHLPSPSKYRAAIVTGDEGAPLLLYKQHLEMNPALPTPPFTLLIQEDLTFSNA